MKPSRESMERKTVTREAQMKPSVEHTHRSLSNVKKSWLKEGWRYLWAVFKVGKEPVDNNIEDLLWQGWTFCMRDEFPEMKSVREEMEKAGLRTQKENYITKKDHYLMKIPEELWKEIQKEERARYELQNKALYTVEKDLHKKNIDVSPSRYSNSFGY